jgi:hypothetical protein
MRILESRMTENGHVRFGGGPSEKGQNIDTSPAAYPVII